MSQGLDISEALERFIDRHGLSYKKNSISYIFDCPRCGKNKLYMYRDTGRFTCWVCSPDAAPGRSDYGFQGRAEFASCAAEFALCELAQVPIAKVKIALYGDKPLPNASEWVQENLAKLRGLDDDYEGPREIPTITWDMEWFPIDHHHAAKGAAYLQSKRSIDLEVAKSYGIRYSPKARSIAFPVTYDSRLIGYQTRVVFDVEGTKTPKSLTSLALPRERVVMFEDRVTADYAILLEGPIDAIKTRLCGGGVATLGKKVSPGQIQRLCDLGVRRFYLALDADAWAESNRLNRELHGMGLQVFSMRAPAPYEDFGDMPEAEVLAVFMAAPVCTPGTIFAPW